MPSLGGALEWLAFAVVISKGESSYFLCTVRVTQAVDGNLVAKAQLQGGTVKDRH